MTTQPADDTPPLPPAELAVLQALRNFGYATVRELAQSLYPPANQAQCATVQKLLDRLDRKGYVMRNRAVWPHLLHAIADHREGTTCHKSPATSADED